MMEAIYDVLFYLDTAENARALVVTFAAFAPPLLFIVFTLPLKIRSLKKTENNTFSVLGIYFTFVWILGFITQLILLFAGVPPLKMAFIWIAMVIVYFSLFFFKKALNIKVFLYAKEFFSDKKKKR